MSLVWVFLLVALQRIGELAVSRRNLRILLARGGWEFHAGSFRIMVALHGTFLVALVLESFPWRVPADLRTFSCLSFLLVLAGLRYWCISTLGPCWNTRIVLVPGTPVIRRGPYRFMRHPNYLVVVLEFIFLPFLCRAPITLVLFSVANLLVLRQRIRLEEAALGAFTDFARVP